MYNLIELTNLILSFIILDLLFLIFIESLVQLYRVHSAVALSHEYYSQTHHHVLCLYIPQTPVCAVVCGTNEYYSAPRSDMYHGRNMNIIIIRYDFGFLSSVKYS